MSWLSEVPTHKMFFFKQTTILLGQNTTCKFLGGPVSYFAMLAVVYASVSVDVKVRLLRCSFTPHRQPQCIM